MTGLDGRRVYLDWNATAPLARQAHAAMLAAMDAVGNPSSVHAEGRAAKVIVETARGQVAALVGCAPDEVVFTSGATEAAMLALKDAGVAGAAVEHDCVACWTDVTLPVDAAGIVALTRGPATRQSANSETGVVQPLAGSVVFEDAVQAAGKIAYRFDPARAPMAAISAHKLGGPKGVGALIVTGETCVLPMIRGGGQERGRRAGTENVIGIAGFGAAAEAARQGLEENLWARVEKLRNILEDRLAAAAPETIFFGQECPRLPNTACFAVPGWAGETQVMALDLAGFAVSAGAACSSGKVKKASRVLMAMGYDEVTASSAIRVSMGPTTTEAEVMAFADAWEALHAKRRTRAA